MESPNEDKKMKCDEIEFLLIKRNFDEPTMKESLLVEEHLENCSSCRNYQKTLSNLQESMKETLEGPVPDPAIRKRVVKRMEALKPEQAGMIARG